MNHLTVLLKKFSTNMLNHPQLSLDFTGRGTNPKHTMCSDSHIHVISFQVKLTMFNRKPTENVGLFGQAL